MPTAVDVPRRADGVQLIGQMEGSGYRTPPALVRRTDGQVLQLTALLYLVLDAIDGDRSYEEVAEAVSAASGRGVTADNVRTLVDGRLRPLGLLARTDGTAPEVRRAEPLLGLRFRVAVTDREKTHRLTDPFRFLFRPVIWSAVVLAFLVVVWWVFFDQGLGPAAYDAFERPHLLLLVFVVTVLSGGFHEFGHAAAARYGGAEPGVMGAGLYLVWPAFYTDVTDSYRLPRSGRLRTDLGGLYFNAIVAVSTFGVWWATGVDALLLLVATQVLQMVQQLLPLLRYDGYHVLADLAGVPDLYHRIRPTLAGLLPWNWRKPEHRVLRPGPRVLITAWVLVTLPLMALMLVALVLAIPRLLGSAAKGLGREGGAVLDAAGRGDLLDLAASALQVLALVLPVLAAALVLGRLASRTLRGLLGWSRGSAPRRIVASVGVAALVTGLVWAWWPTPQRYDPIGPNERLRLTQVLEQPTAARVSPVSVDAVSDRLGQSGPVSAVFSKTDTLPTREKPTLALVLVPQEGSTAEEWVFPFTKPPPPGEGDNRAEVYNTDDGSVRYDVAFAMVWADGDEVMNENAAYAYASCTDCVTVAVAFQIVFVMDDAEVIVPKNLAGALNYDCQSCITAAIADQLVLSVHSTPDDEQLRALGEVWEQLLAFGADITQYTLDEIVETLEQVKRDILAILGEAPVVEPQPADGPSPSPSGTVSGGPSPTAEPSSESSSEPSPSPSTSASASPDATETGTTPEPSPEVATTPEPSPSP